MPQSDQPLVPAVLVCGAGAWGTALAIHLARRAGPGQVQLWSRDEDQAESMVLSRSNVRYLPGVDFPPSLRVVDSLDSALAHWRATTARLGRGLLILAVPVAGLAALAAALGQRLVAPEPGEGVVWLSKGLLVESTGLRWPAELVATGLSAWPMGALSGPSFAAEVARGLPVALTLASQQADWARESAAALFGGGMRVYASTDLIGVQLGGAMKNVLAIAAGVADQLALGHNARAALITRGLAETARLGLRLGAQPETFLGLAALGDLVLTATGDLSRNRRVGMGLAMGQPLPQVLAGLGHVAEGVLAAPALAALADAQGVDCPITQAVCRLLRGEQTAEQAIASLLMRSPADDSVGRPLA